MVSYLLRQQIRTWLDGGMFLAPDSHILIGRSSSDVDINGGAEVSKRIRNNFHLMQTLHLGKKASIRLATIIQRSNKPVNQGHHPSSTSAQANGDVRVFAYSLSHYH
jgi:hypothetical protein